MTCNWNTLHTFVVLKALLCTRGLSTKIFCSVDQHTVRKSFLSLTMWIRCVLSRVPYKKHTHTDYLGCYLRCQNYCNKTKHLCFKVWWHHQTMYKLCLANTDNMRVKMFHFGGIKLNLWTVEVLKYPKVKIVFRLQCEENEKKKKKSKQKENSRGATRVSVNVNGQQ